ncbi:DUF1810 domain-containing protein [Paractinoplanes atraurantiacus]|uniref:DUF1810 domain-containing protein n=1 Tax=Paractinoplanes atraurantiacus TaxID=1036182 RepID=UPI0031838662
MSAQKGVYDEALDEIRQGRKRTHWMWFVFPQLAGLGSSYTAQFYAIRDLDEARDYLAHPVLGARLVEIAEAVVASPAATADQLFGYPDNLKARSSMTLFRRAAPEQAVFGSVLDKYYGGEPDPRTEELLS